MLSPKGSWNGILERAPNTAQGREFDIPHKGVVRQTAESTKLRIVYDASARAWDGAPSLAHPYKTSYGVWWFEDVLIQLLSLGISRKQSYRFASDQRIEMHSVSSVEERGV